MTAQSPVHSIVHAFVRNPPTLSTGMQLWLDHHKRLARAASIHCCYRSHLNQRTKEDEIAIRMHRWSQLFIPTLREAPSDAEVASHKFLLRSGYIRQLSAGIYSYLFLGQRSILKISNIVRQEMDKIGQEFYLPALNPREVWEASGRWSIMGDNMFRLKDRKGADL